MEAGFYGIVYKATNLTDGKIYIGQTIQALRLRRGAHENLAGRSTAYFHRAIQKHGPESFQWEVVEECNSKEELHAREIYWIEHFKCMAPSGYNSAEGGKGGAYLESHKKRISETMKGRPRSEQAKLKQSLAMKGRKVSPETLEKFRARVGEKNHFFGRTHSEETRRLIGEKSKGRNWATGEKAGSWCNADRRLILECYFAKKSNKEMSAIHLEKTGCTASVGALFRVFKELGLFISPNRGRRGLRERHEFIDSADINVYYEKLKQFDRPSLEPEACSPQACASNLSHPQLHSDSIPCNL